MKVRPQVGTSAVQTRLDAACADRRIERFFRVTDSAARHWDVSAALPRIFDVGTGA